ncbi:MAG: AAA family ATPase [Clostridiales bacterium]|nr:AAA family ATPase [Clostridiales bacterium]
MKLLSCHIENYGKITDRDLTFDDKITSFCEANGYGKTTLASFLKSMFYGLETDRADRAFNERRHFYPFNGKSFGGNLTFSSNGKTYKIERFFDEKSEKKDSLTVYCNGKVATEFSDGSIGEKLFGIDKQSFERTIFISGTEIEISSTGSINTKLNNFIEGVDDNSNLETAVNKLQSKSKLYKKSKAGNDLISTETTHINNISQAIANAQTIASGLRAKYDTLNDLNREIVELTKTISEDQSANVILNDWEHLDGYNAEIEQKQTELKSIKVRYPHGIPTVSEVDEVNSAIEKNKTLTARAGQKFFSDEDAARFEGFKKEFKDGVPSDDELKSVQNKIQEYTSISYDVEKLKQTKSSQKEAALKQHFAYRIPTKEEVAELDKKASAYKAAESKANAIPEFITTTETVATENNPTQSVLVKILLILSAALLVAGLVTVFFATIVGVVLLAVGFVGLLAAGFLFLNRKASIHATGKQQVFQRENPQRREADKERDGILNQIQAFLAPYGYSLENGVAFAVASFKTDVNSYRDLQDEDNNNKALLDEKLRRLQALEKQLKVFFARYNIAETDNYSVAMSNLCADIKDYISLLNMQKTQAEYDSGLKNDITENNKPIVAFCKKYEININTISETIKRIYKDITDINNIETALNEITEKVKRFAKEKNLTERPTGEQVDIQALNEKLEKLRDAKSHLTTDIMNDEYEAEKLDGLKNEYETAKEKLEEYQTTYKLLTKTIDFLRTADENLKDKYVKPIKDQYVYYSSLLEKTLGEKITMDSNLEIRYEQNGKERSEQHLSSGQRAICSLCFRLALIDNMYSDEKPFLILDDPFVGLDEEHLTKVKVMLDELSEKLQIVYFCCHSSRMISK